MFLIFFKLTMCGFSLVWFGINRTHLLLFLTSFEQSSLVVSSRSECFSTFSSPNALQHLQDMTILTLLHLIFSVDLNNILLSSRTFFVTYVYLCDYIFTVTSSIGFWFVLSPIVPNKK